MNDLENRLGSYRPAGPPPDLRARILQRAEEPGCGALRGWLPALTAAAVAFLFYALGVATRADIASRLAVPDDMKPVEQWTLPSDGGLK